MGTTCAQVWIRSTESRWCPECHHVVRSTVTHGEGAAAIDDLLGACGPSKSEVCNEAAFVSSSLS